MLIMPGERLPGQRMRAGFPDSDGLSYYLRTNYRGTHDYGWPKNTVRDFSLSSSNFRQTDLTLTRYFFVLCILGFS